MELSIFTYWKTSKSEMIYNISSRFKEIIFIKFDDMVYIKATIVGIGSGITINMPYDVLMTHRYLKPYYELSRKAIGKPNLDDNYFGSEDPEMSDTEPNDIYDLYIDTMYIVEDITSNTIEAKKGNSYHSFDLEKMKEANVATGAEIMEFNANFKEKYVYDNDEDEDFDERIAIYTALVDKL
jgi:hypothetical protein